MSDLKLITEKEVIQKIAPEHYYLSTASPYVFVDGEIVLAKGDLDFHEDGSIEIKMVEVIHKKNGHGRIFVEYLKDFPNITEIWGESLPEAVPFWSKVGAKFDPVSFKEYINNDEHEEGFLIPFTIAV